MAEMFTNLVKPMNLDSRRSLSPICDEHKAKHRHSVVSKP